VKWSLPTDGPRRATGQRHEGWHGWDDYAAFYDWENARTLGRRDVAFWSAVVSRERSPALELGCGTGRLLTPLARRGVPVIGIDRSAPMLARAAVRRRRLPRRNRPGIVRGDIRFLPFGDARFGFVLAAYGLVQSLLTDRDLDAVLAEMSRVLTRGGRAGFDLVPDLPVWEEYDRRVRLRVRSGPSTVTLIESVRQDRARGLTTFEEEFVERRGRRVARHRFSLVFRTIEVREFASRLDRFGLRVDAISGDYRGGRLREGADAWLILTTRV
jgi:SAM-dependent methyltransferase